MENKNENNNMDKIISLCKRRGFVFPGSEIYGGLSNSWDYGPLGVELKNNIKQLWWKRFVKQRDDIVGIDAALIMNPKVWEASGHVATFSDPLVQCNLCKRRFRADAIHETQLMKKDGTYECPVGILDEYANVKKCGGILSEPKQFNLMFKTFIGPSEEQANVAYFRPETAQAMFVDFKNVLQTTRKKLPFGIAQIGKAFRNEITPGNFIFRTREFEQMEIEYFIPRPEQEEDWQTFFEMWKSEMYGWMKEVGINTDKVSELEVPKDELAHYSKRTIDFEFDFPFGVKELYGLAYRTDFDLKNHSEASGEDLNYSDLEEGSKFIPHVIEPTWGVDRTVLAVLASAYKEEDDRIVLKLNPKVAPYIAAVFPLLKNKPELVEKARDIYNDLKKKLSNVGMIAWDDRGNVGKRYYSQDEIGTPFCITVDFDSLTDDSVTVRDRDTMKQDRVKIKELVNWINDKIEVV